MQRLLGTLRSGFAFPWGSDLLARENVWTRSFRSKPNDYFTFKEESKRNPNTRSVMVGHMLWLARISRFFGCLFISNLSGGSVHKPVATWKSPYIIYAIMWLCILLVHRGRVMLSIPTRTDDPYHSFVNNVGFVIRTLALLKALVNYASMCFGSRSLLQLMKCATLFEKTISPVLTECKRRDRSRMLFNVALRAIIWGSLVSVFVASRMLSSASPNGTLKFLPVGREAVALWSDIAFFFYDSIVYATVIRCSEVLVQYLKSEVARLEAYHMGEMLAATEQWNSVAVVATVRVNVCKIKALKTCLNDTCSPAIVTSTGCLLIFMCVNLHRLFILKPTDVLFWLSVGYMAYSVCCLVDMAFVSEDLAKEARKLKQAAESMAIANPTSEYLMQVRYLYDSIEPEEMCLTGAGFFLVDRALLLTMAGALITYAIILMQTESDLSQLRNLNHVNVSN